MRGPGGKPVICESMDGPAFPCASGGRKLHEPRESPCESYWTPVMVGSLELYSK